MSVYNKGFVLNGKRVSVVGAYSLDGLIAVDYTEGTYDQVVFQDFFRTLVLPLLRPYPQKNSVVVIDNLCSNS